MRPLHLVPICLFLMTQITCKAAPTAWEAQPPVNTINQSVNRSINQSFNQSISPSINQFIFLVFRTHQGSQQTIAGKTTYARRLWSHRFHSCCSMHVLMYMRHGESDAYSCLQECLVWQRHTIKRQGADGRCAPCP